MRRAIKYGFLVVAVMTMLALGMNVSSVSAIAQDSTSSTAAGQATPPGEPPANPGSRNETDQAFDHWMTNNPGAAREIRKDPSLLTNQDYLAKHPDLQKFMSEHQDFAKAAAKNPNRVVRKSVHKEQMSRQRRHEHRQ